MTKLDETGPQVRDRSDRSWLDRFFFISERGSGIGREVRGGLTTFMAMAYIIVLNPIILGGATDINGDSLNAAQLTTMTALSAGIVTILMGVIGRAPIALAAALGVMAVVAYQAVPLMTWPEAMGLVVWQGIIIILMVVTGIRTAVMNALPHDLKVAIGVGIGLFVALIGLDNAGFLSAGDGKLLQLGADGHLSGWPITVFIIGLLVSGVLLARRVSGAIFYGIITATVIAVVVHQVFGLEPGAWGGGVPEPPDQLLVAPDFGLLLQVDMFGAWSSAGVASAGVILFTLVLAGFFDALGTILAVGDKAGLTDRNGQMPRTNEILAMDGVGAVSGGLTSSSATLVFVESTAGVTEGARTGLASVVTGGLFLVAILFAPVFGMVPAQAASVALVLVGAMMMMGVGRIGWDDITVAIPAFLTISLMAFTFDIANGIGAGIVVYTVLRSAVGRHREVGWLMWVLTGVFAVHFGITGVEHLLGV
ncbi:AGZA family xanthine/uracil permease-like MFS transporter [Spinactinospora alkalitolerans]|uniref:AGZA family xanthine/uracil permease-like MFS transporter n=1 Tax=Spinactinospora alkalitolerans TaxID=687207 RepID=A0A852TUJ9_9ACTN|nr:NCS2 family permease [Spinactinospora alkalitolerans]NYE47709.1 AGZA family xanthine/uracil permease-like MFS transporter [Spinactinospora alkalitolerans]